jgi:hypothetical protein
LNFKLIGAILVSGFLAMLFGLLAVTANPVLIGMGAAMVIGPVLLVLPEVSIWIILVVGLLGGVLSANPHLSKLAWAVSLLSLLLLVPSTANLIWTQRRRLPGFMTLAVVFMLYTVALTVAQWYSLEEFIAGFKRYFQSYGLMFALTLLVFDAVVIGRWRKFLLVVALLQFPFALFELVVLVGMRGGVSASSAATDVVAGTFGANLQGGSPNSVMVIYVFAAAAFLFARWRAGGLGLGRFLLFTGICLLPLGMGETKIAVIMLPLVGLSLLRPDLMKAPLRYLPAIAGLVVMTAVLCYLYVVVIMHSSLQEVIDSTMRYNMGDQGYSQGQSLNRGTALSFWFQQQSWSDPLSFLFGHGLGSAYTGGGGVQGHMGLIYLSYGINLTAISTLLWETGVVGCALFAAVFVAAWLAAGRLYREVAEPLVRADALAIQASLALFLLSFPYSDSIVNLVSLELIYAVILGYLGYLMNLHGLLTPRKAASLGAKVRHYG